MEDGDQREVRAARNQALFRSVNERMRDLNETFAAVVGTYAIACECADPLCTGILEIAPEEYAAIRRSPRQFAVLPGHVYPDIEQVIAENDVYAIVEKTGRAAEIVEAIRQDVANISTSDGG